MKDFSKLNKIQNEIINNHLSNHLKRSSIFLSVGGGKTYLALKYCFEYFKNKKVLFTGENQIYLDNAKNEFKQFSKKEFINYSCIDSLNKYINHWDLIIYDEAHKSTGLFNIFLKKIIKINPDVEVLCLTGTPKYKDDNFKELLLLCPEIYTYKSSIAISDNLVNDIQIIPTYCNLSTEKNIHVKTKNYDFYTSEYLSYQNLIKKYLNDSGKGFTRELTYLKLFLKNLKSKESILDNLLDKDKTLIYAGSIDQANRISQKLKCGVYHSKLEKDINKLMFDSFYRGDINLLVNVNSIKESVSIKNLKKGIIMSVDAASHSFEQTLGRFMRLIPDKEIGKIYVLIAKDTIEEEWFKKATINFQDKIINN